jgi:hypothetical protein
MRKAVRSDSAFQTYLVGLTVRCFLPEARVHVFKVLRLFSATIRRRGLVRLVRDRSAHFA